MSYQSDLSDNTAWPQASGFLKLPQMSETFYVIFKHRVAVGVGVG